MGATYLEARHQGSVHAAKFAAPFVKHGGTDVLLPAEFGNRAAGLCLLEDGNDLAI